MKQVDWLAYWTSLTPSATAIIDHQTQTHWSYQALNEQANRTTDLFEKYGLKKGDRIVILAEFCIEYIFLFGAAQKSGVILVPLNYRLTSHEIDQLITDVQPSLILVEDQFQKSVKEKTTNDLKAFFQTSVKQEFNRNSLSTITHDDALFILYTSGSSGVPKGVMYTYKMLFWNAVNTQVGLGINNEARTIVCMPPFHTGGWNVLLTPLMHCGGISVLMKSFDTAEVIKGIEDYEITLFMGVPTMLNMMAQHELFSSAKWSSLKYFIVGGESMPRKLIQIYHNKKVSIRQGFGMTEAGPNITSLHHDDAMTKIGSIGKPNIYSEISIVDENDQYVKDGERGELRLSGPIVFSQYFRKPEVTSSSFKDGWFYTGDIVIRDDEGFLYIVDRKKNMFISGGENVYPAEVEKTILTHPQVAEAVVLGVNDFKWGEVGKALLILKPGSTLSLEELQSYCSDKLSKFKIPKHLEIIDEFPKNDTGKIDRKMLRRMYG